MRSERVCSQRFSPTNPLPSPLPDLAQSYPKSRDFVQTRWTQDTGREPSGTTLNNFSVSHLRQLALISQRRMLPTGWCTSLHSVNTPISLSSQCYQKACTWCMEFEVTELPQRQQFKIYSLQSNQSLLGFCTPYVTKCHMWYLATLFSTNNFVSNLPITYAVGSAIQLNPSIIWFFISLAIVAQRFHSQWAVSLSTLSGSDPLPRFRKTLSFRRNFAPLFSKPNVFKKSWLILRKKNQ